MTGKQTWGIHKGPTVCSWSSRGAAIVIFASWPLIRPLVEHPLNRSKELALGRVE